jgi:hypothetical protein
MKNGESSAKKCFEGADWPMVREKRFWEAGGYNLFT